MQSNQDHLNIPLYGDHFSPLIWFPCGKRKTVKDKIQKLKTEHITSIRIGIDCSKSISKKITQWYKWLLTTLAKDFIVVPCFIFPLDQKEKPAWENQLSFSEFIESFVHKFGNHFNSVEIWRNPFENAKSTKPDQNFLAEEIVFAISWTNHLGKNVCLGGINQSDFNWITQLISCQIMRKVNAISLNPCDDGSRYSKSDFERILKSLFKAKGLETKIRYSDGSRSLENTSRYHKATKSAALNTLLKITG